MSTGFWLTDQQFTRLEPFLPTDTRGVTRVDDHRVISGIVQVFKSGCRWKDAGPAYGPLKRLYNRFVRWRDKGRVGDCICGSGRRGRPASGSAARQHACEGAPLGRWRRRGAKRQAIGVSRGGRNTKLHALSDGAGRPLAFRLPGGHPADAPQAAALLEDVPEGVIVLADKAYDADAIRRPIEARGAVPNIPFKVNRRWKGCFSPFLYKGRNAIERMFCGLEDFRRIAIRYNERADTFVAALQIAVLIPYWL